MEAKKKNTDLAIAIDFGGSMTKAIAIDSLGKQQLVCLEPQVQKVIWESLSHFQQNVFTERAPEDRAWVKLGDDYWAVGSLAKEQFRGTSKLSIPKYHEAVQKTLAVIWVLSKRFSLGKRLKVSLGCLLPPGEYQDRELFQEELTKALVKCVTPDGTMAVRLTEFDCKPEGGGIFLMHRLKRGDKLTECNTGVIMLGYRNASVMIANRGNVGNLQTSNLGFVRLVEIVKQRASLINDFSSLSGAVYSAGERVNPTALTSLLQTTVSSRTNKELNRLIEVVKIARSEYWLQLESWLSEVLPKNIDEVVWGGGTADYLASNLRLRFEDIGLYWHAGISIPSFLLAQANVDPIQQGLNHRFVDVYCYLVYLCDVTDDFSELAISLLKNDEMASDRSLTGGITKKVA